MTYSDAAPTYRDRGWWPIPCRAKRPVPAGATGARGVVNDAKVGDWMIDPEWRDQNVALRHDGTVGIDVDAYGNKRGDEQLKDLEAKLGPLPATFSSTSRGADSPSRQHIFALREPVELVGKAAPDIDIIQHRHRYSLVWPSVNPDAEGNPQYQWYDEDGQPCDVPHVDDLEYLPEAWVEYLLADAKEQHHSEQWDGDIPEVASDEEERKLRTIVARLEGLPDVWAPGAGWHETTRDAACWLWRIARSNAYALTPEAARTLLHAHTPTYPAWGPEKIDAQWNSCEKVTAGQFEEPPLSSRPPLIFLPGGHLPYDQPLPFVDGQPFAAIWASRPEKETIGALWSRRQTLLTALLGAGVDEQRAASFVWHSAAARMAPIVLAGVVVSDSDSKCITVSELWREVDQAKEVLAKGSGEATPAAPVDERPTYEESPRPGFLTDDERAQLADTPADCRWFGERFVQWGRDTFSFTNEPYWRMNRWIVLSVIFAPLAMLPRPGSNHRPLNLYAGIIGPTTSGKTEAMRSASNIFKAYFVLGESPNIGGNHTGASLTKTLIARDGQSSFFNADEAHTKIVEWKKIQGPFSEIPGLLTEYYDGDVKPIYRATDPESSGKHAQTFLTVHLMGTPQEMTDVMEPEDWRSGFLNRFVWAIGDQPQESDDAVAGDWLTADQLGAEVSAEGEGSLMPQQWAAEFMEAAQRVSRHDERPSLIALTPEIIARHKTFASALVRFAKSKPTYYERLRPTFRRLTETTFRCAALVALSEGRLEIQMTDLLIAIEQAEEWAANIAVMVEATDQSLRTREVNAIEQEVLGKGGIMAVAAINRLPRFQNKRRYVDDLIGELIAQGRAERISPEGVEVVKVKGLPAAAKPEGEENE